MKKPTVVLLIVMSVLSITFAIHEAHNAWRHEVKAEKIKIALTEKIRMLEDSLLYISARHEIERRQTVYFEKAVKNINEKEEQARRANTGM